jgi:DNA helicase-4
MIRAPSTTHQRMQKLDRLYCEADACTQHLLDLRQAAASGFRPKSLDPRQAAQLDEFDNELARQETRLARLEAVLRPLQDAFTISGAGSTARLLQLQSLHSRLERGGTLWELSDVLNPWRMSADSECLALVDACLIEHRLPLLSTGSFLKTTLDPNCPSQTLCQAIVQRIYPVVTQLEKSLDRSRSDFRSRHADILYEVDEIRKLITTVKGEKHVYMQGVIVASETVQRARDEGLQRDIAAEEGALLGEYRAWLDRDFLSASAVLNTLPEESRVRNLLVPECEAFAKCWCEAHAGQKLDAQQAAAVAAVSRNVLVTARAGSGKTRTLVQRTEFLIKQCGVSPAHVLLLAFNKKAAVEIKDRLEKRGCACPHVMTFHALAYSVVHPTQTLVYDDEDAGNFSQSRVLQQIINEFLDQPEWYVRVRSLMMDHFKADWEMLIEKGLLDVSGDGLAFRRALVAETLRGDYVKSRGEQVIANFLFEHDIPYLYERNHWWKDINYRPDFTLEGKKVVIEYFGLADDPDYVEQCASKRDYWAQKPDWAFLEYGPASLRPVNGEGIVEDLRKGLESLGIPIRRLSEEDIWNRIRERTLTRFARTLRNFVGRCRKTGLSVAGLSERLRQHTAATDIERRFLDIAASAFVTYLEHLRAQNLVDFDGLLENAAALVESGTTVFARKSGSGDLASMRFIMVDEFQDMAPLFVRVLKGIQRHNSDVQFFGVGDDWQAINAFAGSDLKYFDGFGQWFAPARGAGLSTNYRSAAILVELGNQLMSGKGAPAMPRADAPAGRVVVADLGTFAPAAEEVAAWPGDQISPVVRRLLRQVLAEGKTVAMLTRRSDGVPYYVSRKPNASGVPLGLQGLHGYWTQGLSEAERDAIVLSTAHGFKGREADVVIVLDALERSYPLIHPDWVFARIFGDSISKLIEDERRLFYVACTRAREKLFLLTEGHRESEFLKQLSPRLERVFWDEYPPFVEKQGGWIIQVGNMDGRSGPTYDRKSLLKAHGFSFTAGEWPHWWNTLTSSRSLGDVVDHIQQAAWLPGQDGLLIRIRTDGGTLVEAHQLIGGVLVRCFDGSAGKGPRKGDRG